MSIVKWVGGKKKQLNNLFAAIPDNNSISHFVDLFIGGGSVIIGLLELCEKNELSVQSFTGVDLNSRLINMYQMVKYYSTSLLHELHQLQEQYLQCENQKAFYYEIRAEFNKKQYIGTVKDASFFIFLNKLGFRGIYRENRSGEFNVPFGNYKTINIIQTKKINRLAYLFTKYNVQFYAMKFQEYIKCTSFNENDLVYLDPPYYPVNAKAFVTYTSAGFTLKDHEDVIHVLAQLSKNNVGFIFSNSNTSWIKKHIEPYTTIEVTCRRSIHCKNPQSTAREIIATNLKMISKTW